MKVMITDLELCVKFYLPTAPDFHTLYAFGVQKKHENTLRDSGCE